MENQIKYTPGPWEICQSNPYYKETNSLYKTLQIGFGDFVVAEIPCGKTQELEEEAQANVRLIAASPELLEACKKMAEKMEMGKSLFLSAEEIIIIRQAIAKAEGKS